MKLLKMLTTALVASSIWQVSLAQEVVKFDNPYLQRGEVGLMAPSLFMEYYALHGKCPENNASIGLPAPTAMANEFVQKVTVQGCKIETTLQNKSPVLPALRNKKMVHELVLSTTKQPLPSWVCSGDEYNPYLLEACLGNPVGDALALVSAVKAAVAEYYNNYAQCPKDNNAVGWGGIETATVKSVTVEGCKITSQIRNSAPVFPMLQGKKIELTGVPTNGSMYWTCKTDVEDKYKPQGCQKF